MRGRVIISLPDIYVLDSIMPRNQQSFKKTCRTSKVILHSCYHQKTMTIWHHCWLVVTSIPISPLNSCPPQNKSPGRMKQYFLRRLELLGSRTSSCDQSDRTENIATTWKAIEIKDVVHGCHVFF